MASDAFGAPGVPGRWTSAQKSGVGAALDGSPIWFTLSHGILNEVYWPRMDQAAIRDLGFIITGPDGYFVEEKRQGAAVTKLPEPGVPYYLITSTAPTGEWELQKEVLCDPLRPVVLQRVSLRVKQGNPEDYHLYAILASHLDNHGAGNSAWRESWKGIPALFAARDSYALALIADPIIRDGSVGFVGYSDGWQDLRQHGTLSWHFDRADNGNVALTAELDTRSGPVTLALGAGRTASEAAVQARGALASGFDQAEDGYVQPWKRWQQSLWSAPGRPLYPISAMVVRVHQSDLVPGGILASLSVPWGSSKGDGDLGGYHLVWSRDMVEAAGGLLAAGDGTGVRRALEYLRAVQEADGHWHQNMWLDGTPYWSGIQMDETALPILLFDLARREGVLAAGALHDFWPMIRQAAQYLVQNGPVTQQDRWEEDGGYTPFTLAAEIAALLAAAELAELSGEPAVAPYLRETADAWNAQVERWLYVENTETAREVGVDGYYVRITPADYDEGDSLVPIKNRLGPSSIRAASAIVSTDALALVRFGLRAPDDPRILNTVKVIDALLRTETPRGPSWHRYNEDGYGEHEDGSPFDGTGVGRLWPLLTGERAHYALASGDLAETDRLTTALESFVGEGGLLPEQIWDTDDRPDRELYFGRPSGSAMPLVWAHAEYLKLVRSRAEERVFDMPPQTVTRYLHQSPQSPQSPPEARRTWRFNHKIRQIRPGSRLRVETLVPARIHCSMDGWATTLDLDTQDSGLGVHYADVPTAGLAAGSRVIFTFYWPSTANWEGTDFEVTVAD
ncbi:MAG: glycoside hydrolase family 15 protein [Firmicutes bacterium]|nr:glycoside hydrolase family 15 protein [Bacillota bacterium]